MQRLLFNLKWNTFRTLSFLNQKAEMLISKKTEPYKTAIFSERGEVRALIELEVKIKIIRGVILQIAADHPDTDFKIRDLAVNQLRGRLWLVCLHISTNASYTFNENRF